MSEEKEKEQQQQNICPHCKHNTHKTYMPKFANGELLFSQCDCGCKVIHGVNMQQSRKAMKKLYKQLKKELHKS